jgi:hypothetical protein
MNADLPPGDGGLMSNPAHWGESGVTTATQLADYLDDACANNIENSEISAYS